MPEPTTRDERLAAREFYTDDTVTLYLGDALDVLRLMPDGSVDCIVTSPPYYGLRDYGVPGQYGLEATPGEYVDRLRATFAEARRVLSVDGTLWLNLGDSYNNTAAMGNSPNAHRDGSSDAKQRSAENAIGRRRSLLDVDLPAKNMLGIPWRTAFALQDDGWILRNAIVWHKPNAMPESVTDRLSTRHELLFLFSRSQRYWFDLDAIREPLARPEALDEGIVFGGRNGGNGKLGGSARRSGGDRSVYGRHAETDHRIVPGAHDQRNERGRNPGDVWSISTRPYRNAHFATFPIDLPLRCIKAGCKPDGTVLDLFSGAGTAGVAARMLMRRYVGIDVNRAYHGLAIERFAQGVLL